MYSSEIEHQKLASSVRSSKGLENMPHTETEVFGECCKHDTVLKHLFSRKEFMMDQLIKLITQTNI